MGNSKSVGCDNMYDSYEILTENGDRYCFTDIELLKMTPNEQGKYKPL